MHKRNVTTLVLLTVYCCSLYMNWAFNFVLKKSQQCYLIFNHFIHQNHQVPVVELQEVWHFAFSGEVVNIKKLCVQYPKELDNVFLFCFQLPLIFKSVRSINKLLKHPVSSVFVIQDKFRTYRLSLRGNDRQGWYDIICSKPTFKQLPGSSDSCKARCYGGGYGGV